jgi:predicted nucleic acid-binding protein
VTRYFDASAIVKRYVREAGSTTVRRLLASAVAATSRLSEVEVASAIVRRAREGSFSADQRDRMLNALDDDLPALAIVEVIPAVAADARFLLLRHALRPGDAIQLASCLYLQRQLGRPIPFVVYDRRLALAARAEGLAVVGVRSDVPQVEDRAPRVRNQTGASDAQAAGNEPPTARPPTRRGATTRRP